MTFDATATSTNPTPTDLGTFLGDTLTAECASDGAGGDVLTVNISTTDGSWNIDYTQIDQHTSSVGSQVYPPGTITSPMAVPLAGATSTGNEEDDQLDMIQLAPSPGSMIWHGMATTNTASPTCHLSIQYFPEAITATHDSAHADAGTAAHLPHRLGNIPLHLTGR